jgi:ADP-ribose pyrophosphatase
MTVEKHTTRVVNLKHIGGYDGFFKLRVYSFQHSRFDGSMSPEITREVFERGTAVGVLPYDPERDEVLLIQQFLIGAHIAGVQNCPLQVVAGMVEKDESGQDVAQREAMEEAGCDIGRMRKAYAFLPSPGGSSERVETYVAEADLSQAGGQFGLEAEDEDIRAVVLSAEEAIALLDAGEIEAGPAVVALSWFARHHPALRAEWLNTPAPKA